MPRFQGEAFAANLRLLAEFEALAKTAGCTPAQLCLAWLMAKDPALVSIPGTTSPAHMLENAAAADITLPADVVAKVDELVNGSTVSGSRYPPALQASVDMYVRDKSVPASALTNTQNENQNPFIAGQLAINAVFGTAFDEPAALLGHFLGFFLTHGTTQQVGTAE